MPSHPQDPTRLVLIGGGLTAAAFAIHAIRASTGALAIDIIEPAAEVGRGIAYGTTDPAHRINVPSNRMSLFGDDPDDLTRWLFAHAVLPDPASTDPGGLHYVARHAFGSYVIDTLARVSAAATGRVTLRHRRTRASAIAERQAGWAVDLADGTTLEADGVVLCCGHNAPLLPCPVSEAALRSPGFVANAWAPDAFAGIAPDDAVLIVGTGLTMADVVASLDRVGHRGPLTAISRRSLLPRPQGLFLSSIDFLDGAPPPTTALALLRHLRRRIAALAPTIGWQPVVDALRFDLQRLWRNLPPVQQRLVMRRLLPFWEVHRFRIAPQPHDLLRRLDQAGRIAIERASIARVEGADSRLVAHLRPFGASTPTPRTFDAIVLCTGPGNALRGGIVAALVDRGIARPDAVGLGLGVDAASRVLDPRGAPHATLWALGPITRGTFGEMTGEPDIVRHIERIVPAMLQSFGDDRQGSTHREQMRRSG